MQYDACSRTRQRKLDCIPERSWSSHYFALTVSSSMSNPRSVGDTLYWESSAAEATTSPNALTRKPAAAEQTEVSTVRVYVVARYPNSS